MMGTGVGEGTGVCVGGTGVAVGIGVLVGATVVAVGETVCDTEVAIGSEVCVGSDPPQPITINVASVRTIVENNLKMERTFG